ncbi:MAG TPA: hypothetical protein PLF26_06065 [Blastocatellia bacterium]|nr:hypothetical protein [Blastocatellia bacterium]
MACRVVATMVFLVVLGAVASAAQSGRVRRVNPPPAAPAATPAPAADPAEPVRAAPRAVTAKFDTKYAGGSLGYDYDEKVVVAIKDGIVTFSTKTDHVEVEAVRINDVSYGQRIRQRTAEAVGVGSVIPGLGGIIGNTKSTAHYIEIVWGAAPAQGVALRVDKGDYENLINAIEAATGLTVRREAAPAIKDIP